MDSENVVNIVDRKRKLQLSELKSVILQLNNLYKYSVTVVWH